MEFFPHRWFPHLPTECLYFIRSRVYGLTWWCIDQTRVEGGGPSGSVDRREKEKVARTRRHHLTWMTHGLCTQQQNPCDWSWADVVGCWNLSRRWTRGCRLETAQILVNIKPPGNRRLFPRILFTSAVYKYAGSINKKSGDVWVFWNLFRISWPAAGCC